MAIEFFLEDGDDGWWHCPSPLRCVVIDGPATWFELRPGARFPETYWLVRCDPAIEWHGDGQFAARWGPDHPLCHPIEPTSFALVMASSSWSGPIDPARTWGIPAYPVAGDPRSVDDAKPIVELAIKAGVRTALG